MERLHEDHNKQCFVVLTELRNEGKLCDIDLEVEGELFQAHRCVLAAASPYFCAMFTGCMEESRSSQVTLHAMSPRAVEILLDYCYTGKILVTSENVQDLLPAADILQLSWVRRVCCDFLISQLDTSNCLGICVFANTHSCSELQQAAGTFAQQHYLEVLEGSEFLQLDPADLVELLQSEDLNVENEEQVFESVMKWAEHEVASRQAHLSSVLQHVRLPLLDRSYLVKRVGKEPLIRNCTKCRDIVDEAKNYLLLPELRTKLEGPWTRPRRPVQSNEVMYAVGGWCSGDAIAMVEYFNTLSSEWKVVAPMSKRRCGVGVGVLGDFLYAIGGHDGSSYLNSVERYDPKTDQWMTSVAPTLSCRTSIGVGVLNGLLYAIGGQDGVSCLNIVESYDPTSNCWQTVNPMHVKRLGVGVAVLGGYMYAVGGSDGSAPLSSVERFDPVSGQWAEVASLMCKRKHLGVAVYDNSLYAVGGRDQLSELGTVEKYNPSSDTWTPVVAMNTRRSGVGLCVLQGKLYALGGFDGCTYLKSVEWLDIKHNMWRAAPAMNYRRLGCGVGKLQILDPTSCN